MASLGIAVRRSCIRAALVRHKQIIWHGSVLVDGEQTAEALDQLLSLLPPRTGARAFTRPRVVLAIGTAYVQMKRIDGLPAARNQKLLTEVVRQNSAAFFLRGTGRLVISDVDHRADGSNWAAAYHADTLDGLVAALRRRGMTRQEVVPTIAAVSSLLGGGTRIHEEGRARLEIVSSDHGIVTAIRRVTNDLAPEVALPSGLADVGADYLEAYASALTGTATKLSWRPPTEPRRARRAETLRLAAAALLFVATSSVALMTTGMRAKRDAARATAEIQGSQTLSGEASRVQGELARVSTQLDRIDKFEQSRGKMTMLVGAIAQALPESTALVTLRVDSVEGSFATLTRHAADVLPELATIDGIINPKIVGSVTRETQGVARLERATIRFRRPRSDVRPGGQPASPGTRAK